MFGNNEMRTVTSDVIAAANSAGKFIYGAVRSTNTDTTATGKLFSLVFRLKSGVNSANVVVSASVPDGFFTNMNEDMIAVGNIADITATLSRVTTTTTTTTTTEKGMPGDVNLDKSVNLADVRSLIAAISSGSVNDLSSMAKKNADVTYDGKIDLADVRKLVSAIASGDLTSLDK